MANISSASTKRGDCGTGNERQYRLNLEENGGGMAREGGKLAHGARVLVYTRAAKMLRQSVYISEL